MKHLDIITLVNFGVLGITDYDLEAKDAYKVFRFRQAVEKALDIIQEKERELLAKSDINDSAATDSRVRELSKKESKTEEEVTELNSLKNKIKEFNESRKNMLEEAATLENVTPLSYKAWHILRKENHPKNTEKVDPLNNYVEGLLKGILWEVPEENN